MYAPVPPGQAYSPGQIEQLPNAPGLAPDYRTAPGANWRPAQKPPRGPGGLVISLVVVLVVAVVGGVVYGIVALTGRSLFPTQAGTYRTAATATARSGQLLNDPLTSSSTGWSENSRHCNFASDGYHIANAWMCNAPIGNIEDASVTVTVEQVSGSTLEPYGISFRYNPPDTHYFFGIDSNSNWVFFRTVAGQGTRLQDYTANQAILGGLNVKNTLTVDFRGQAFTCWVNGTQVGTIADSGSSLASGQVALEAGTDTTAVFTNFVAQT